MPQTLRWCTNRKMGRLQAPSGTSTPSVKPPAAAPRLCFPTCVRERMRVCSSGTDSHAQDHCLNVHATHISECAVALRYHSTIARSHMSPGGRQSPRLVPPNDGERKTAHNFAHISVVPSMTRSHPGCRLYPKMSAMLAVLPTERKSQPARMLGQQGFPQ
jgi:hypothetical protein